MTTTKTPRKTPGDVPNVAAAPTSATTEAPWPPFTHFPWARGDWLSGEPVPCTPNPEVVAAMPMGVLQRRLKVLGQMMKRRRLGERFVEAARAEADVLAAELWLRFKGLLAGALGPKREKRSRVAQKQKGP